MSISSFTHHLSDPTQFFGLKLWITILVFFLFLTALVALLSAALWWSACRRRRRRRSDENDYGRLLSSRRGWDDRVVYSDHSHWSRSHHVDMPAAAVGGGGAGRCERNGESEIELTNDGFSHGSVEHRVVYREDEERVAMEIIIRKSGNGKEFMEEAEAVWGIRHNNLVKLIGSSIDGSQRTLVYEYVDNGNLYQWLHQGVATTSPLTWNIRMGIILGVTKGLAYLHEDSDPKVIHQYLTSSSILLDHQWNPKISDIGITKLLGPEQNQFVSRKLFGMSGYIAPECVATHNFNEKSDVYSFGVLVMEIISGRTPVKYNESNKKEYLVEWLKLKVREQRFDEIVDPRLQEPPTIKELKRIILIALRCVDPDFENRPAMGEVIHMLEPRDLLLDDVISLFIHYQRIMLWSHKQPPTLWISFHIP